MTTNITVTEGHWVLINGTNWLIMHSSFSVTSHHPHWWLSFPIVVIGAAIIGLVVRRLIKKKLSN
jgi:hypothetical protein